jgi:hypothetical protein
MIRWAALWLAAAAACGLSAQEDPKQKIRTLRDLAKQGPTFRTRTPRCDAKP